MNSVGQDVYFAVEGLLLHTYVGVHMYIMYIFRHLFSKKLFFLVVYVLALFHRLVYIMSNFMLFQHA